MRTEVADRWVRRRLVIGVSLLVMPAVACGISALGTLGSSNDDGEADSSVEEVGPGVGTGRPADGDVPVDDAGDAAGDASDLDATGDSSTFRCGTVGVPTCLACEAGIYACAADKTCVADCKTCDASPVQCVACTGGAVIVAAAVCENIADAGACTAPPLARCLCDAATDCPGARQVCKQSGCAACGEQGTDTLKCKGPPLNKACDSDGTGSVADELTCR